MCLAEALLRIPDAETADALIRDKIGGADWEKHVGSSDSLFVNASTWALILIHLRREMEDNFLVRHADGAASQPVQVARLLASRQ